MGGDARFRGNCAPQVYEWLIRQSGARSLIDPCFGSGTSLDVALRLGLDAQGSDLSVGAYHQGVASRLRARGAQVRLGLDASAPGWPGHFRAADLVVAHPAYGTQLAYHARPRQVTRGFVLNSMDLRK
ncbi:hypothetical protein GCM10008959_31840 [Deinococcus seoulensis]|uniref:DNA methylase N-4/N-6 domain-containing protein n=1 Tax=Deinococcus seoulensis TaxID=1837379 RepID=A0ABQ2RU58_9DEIO|nr:hypothetical protein [Deinococcus seoulensis]GGR67295.1 hypothetical protein GCM10008959_31840 [Deinococcus seoulensis]